MPLRALVRSMSSLFLYCVLAVHAPFPPVAGAQTWSPLGDLSERERTALDLRVETPRDPNVSYLPAEKYPFKSPFTAEEMGLRAMQFPHSPFGDCILIDMAFSVTSSGALNQRVTIIPILYLPEDGLRQHLYQTPPGEEVYRWLSQSVSPPERFGSQTLWIGYRTDKAFTTKIDMFVYSPSLRRIRRQPQPRREDRLPNSAATFDNLIGRDAWEFSWRILGTDVLHETVRFPATRKNAILTDEVGNYIEVSASDLPLMGKEYAAYTENGGVECYVIEAVPRNEWLSGYYASKLIYWVDKQAFFPLRVEEFDEKGNLSFVNTRIATLAQPNLGDEGYGVLFDLWWDISIDYLSASIHGFVRREWSEEDRKIFFSSGFMRREWFLAPPKGLMSLNSPDEFYLRPSLKEEAFPSERNIVLEPALRKRIEAQEREKKLVFELSSDTR